MLSGIVQLIKDLLFFTGYVNTGTSFPEPLSKEDEASYILAYVRSGDAFAREKLIEHNLRLVAHIAKNYGKAGLDMDDVVSIGMIGLIKAVESFNPERGSLVAYASRCIENEIRMYMRKERKRTQNEVSFDEPIGRDNEGNEMTIIDKVGTDGEIIQNEVFRTMLHDKVGRVTREVLNDRERIVLTLRYSLDGDKSLPQREVADILGVSRSYVSRIEKRALNKLSNYFDKDG